MLIENHIYFILNLKVIIVVKLQGGEMEDYNKVRRVDSKDT